MKLFFIFLMAFGCFAASTVNHLNTREFPPDNWIDSVQDHISVYFASTSHGTQIKSGIDSLQEIDAKYTSPTWDAEWYIPAEFYREGGAATTRSYLNANPSVNIAMFMWCDEFTTHDYNADSIQQYLDTMADFEADYPGVTFIYATANSQYYATNAQVLNRHIRNCEIRHYCEDNDKWLFDFGDMDAWYWTGSAWSDSSFTYGDSTIPMLHNQYNDVEAEVPAHTTWANALNKGRAMWQLLAMISGWNSQRRSDWNMTPLVRFRDKNVTAYTYDPIFALRTDSSGALFRGSIGSASIHFWHYNVGGSTTTGTIAGSNLSHCGNGVWRARFPASDLNMTDSIFKYRMYGTNIDTTIVRQMRLR